MKGVLQDLYQHVYYFGLLFGHCIFYPAYLSVAPQSVLHLVVCSVCLILCDFFWYCFFVVIYHLPSLLLSVNTCISLYGISLGFVF